LICAGFALLPRDILRLLFSESYLDLPTLVSCRSTCRLFAGLLHLRDDIGCFTVSAADYGYLNLLRWAWPTGCPGRSFPYLCHKAAANGDLQLLQWGRTNGCLWDKWTCRNAAAGGHLQVLQWARANGCPWDPDTCASAAQEGHLEVLRWAHANGSPWDENTCAHLSTSKCPS
jgi:hypothetical protein